MSLPRILLTIFLVSLLLSGMPSAQDKTEKIPVQPITKKSNEIVVFSFYDTQLELVCYSAAAGVFCIPESKLSTTAQAFIKDRVTKFKEKTFGLKSIIVPRIVPLEN